MRDPMLGIVQVGLFLETFKALPLNLYRTEAGSVTRPPEAFRTTADLYGSEDLRGTRSVDPTALHGCFCKLGVQFVDIFVVRARLFGVDVRASDFQQLPHLTKPT